MARHKDQVLNFAAKLTSWDEYHYAIAMDLRDELKQLNKTLSAISTLLHCHNMQAIPRKLDRISRNTAKPRQKKEQATATGV